MIDQLLDGNVINVEHLEGCPVHEHHFPQGWTNLTEVNLLYTLAKNVEGPVLEIGPWLGRSTLAIAAAIRDSGKETPFDTIDYGPTSIAEWNEMFGDTFSAFLDNDAVVRSIHTKGGSTAVLIDTIRNAGLLQYVTTFVRGDFLKVPKRSSYSMIFCDTLHDEREIHAYGAAINELLEPGGWLLCDDIYDERLGTILQKYIACDLVGYSKDVDEYSKFMVARKAGGTTQTPPTYEEATV
ncbi:class I SAM-dependent methyltransferase [Sphingomonas crocodyli]|uniref:Class I SAM-dependent methyltransferase n=1 Tax=Sphingomonas crocodyli TaxID=1979270 RepID=A0A437M525_9SPHN|nr:class I SAM-dependent methyltransferase [Sphingomonas crocodyli]RVT92831.1 class I SAM-dependent methyltransferase [Sphingomonas crocodyli]